MSILEPFISFLETLSQQIPLPLFVVAGSVIEEIIAPIPSPLVMTLAGTMASSHASPHLSIIAMAFLGAFAKTLASWIIYFVSDKAEDLLTNKWGRYLGIDQDELESIGRKLNQGNKDNIVIFSLRALPIIPTAVVSIACGLLKINLKTFLTATFIGLIPRNLFYLYLGYVGTDTLKSLNQGIDSIESLGNVVIAGLFALAFGYIVYQKKKPKK